MVEQKKMTQHNGHNGKTSPFVSVARDVSQVAHDVVELAELQAALARTELQGWWKQFIMPVVLLLIGAVVAASCILLLMASAALQLSEVAELSVPLSLLLVAVAGIVLTLALSGAAYLLIKKTRGPLQQSKQELTRNLRWIKTALKTSTQPAMGNRASGSPS